MPLQGNVTNYNVQQIFIGENWYIDKKYTNSTGSDIIISNATVLGTVLATNTWNLFKSTNSDGSEIPTAIFYNESFPLTVSAGATVTLSGCNKGYINQNGIVFALNTDTINTPVGAEGTGGSVQDLIRRAGIILVPSTELSVTDPNQ
jgi:hypothetical protein